MDLLTFLVLMHGPPFVVAKCLLRWRPHWRRWAIALFAAAAIPLLLMIPLAIELIHARQAPPSYCGIDYSCAAAGIIEFGMAFVVVLFLCGFLVSSLVVYPLPRTRGRESTKISK
ncbi:hypothetical protein [Novosphingobium sp.]|uniref:hypothetical protein n=1 Tax=Novosphingobium sp. TaxID=1874826 RepID=UPI00334294CC